MPTVCEGDTTRVSRLEVAEHRCFLTSAGPAINSVSFFVIAPLNLGQTAHSKALRKGHAHHSYCRGWELNNREYGHEFVPGRLGHQYECCSVRARRVPTTLRERRCHNCRPTKMTCSPVILGRADTTNLAQFPLKSNYTGEKLYPGRTRRKPIPKYRSRPSSNGCALFSLA